MVFYQKKPLKNIVTQINISYLLVILIYLLITQIKEISWIVSLQIILSNSQGALNQFLQDDRLDNH